MTPERIAEQKAHDELRDALRKVGVAQFQRMLTEGQDDDDVDTTVFAETLLEVEGGVLVDYVTVAVYDSGSDDHTVTVISRTDGKCAQYRTVGLLTQALEDTI